MALRQRMLLSVPLDLLSNVTCLYVSIMAYKGWPLNSSMDRLEGEIHKIQCTLRRPPWYSLVMWRGSGSLNLPL